MRGGTTQTLLGYVDCAWGSDCGGTVCSEGGLGNVGRLLNGGAPS